ncbi:MAG: SDR family oxidoreductase, partial [Dehalococcoidia bacterium]|nr:SDR family oxidoreductase [Dehalococcoidia bacterium]
QKDGHVIIMGSNLGSTGARGKSSYAAANSGLYGLMKSAAIELGEYNIQVNVVNPGRVLHPGDVLKERNLQESNLKRINDASEVGDFYVYLSRMKNISGQILNLDSRVLF